MQTRHATRLAVGARGRLSPPLPAWLVLASALLAAACGGDESPLPMAGSGAAGDAGAAGGGGGSGASGQGGEGGAGAGGASGTGGASAAGAGGQGGDPTAARCAKLGPASEVRASCERTGNGTATTWSRCAGGLTDDDASAVAVDRMGNVYVGIGLGDSSDGETEDALACWGLNAERYGTVTFDDMSVTSHADEDPALAKYDKSGKLLWVKSAPGMGKEGEIFGLAVDPSDNSVVAVGAFVGEAGFDPAKPLRSSHLNLFVVRFDPEGSARWSETASLTPSMDGAGAAVPQGVAIDPVSGNILVSGEFEGTLVFDTATMEMSLRSQGKPDLFLVEYDKQGNVLWADSAGGAKGESAGFGVSIDPMGNRSVAGQLTGAATKQLSGASGSSLVLTTYGGLAAASDALLVHYDKSGNLLWATHAGFPTKQTVSQSVAHDSAGNVYVTGTFRGCALFAKAPHKPGTPAPAPGVDPAVPNPPCTDSPTDLTVEAHDSNDNDQFLAKYDPDGNLLWVKKAGGPERDRGYAIAVYDPGPISSGGFLYVGGRIRSIATFGAAPGLVEAVRSKAPGASDDSNSIAKYDLDGELLWVQAIGADGDNDFAALALDPNDGAVVGTGTFVGMGTFPGDVMLQSSTDALNEDDILLYRIDASGP
ncbi:MAG: SBBP repeat-containing protein [Proteobacteria bacterium]|nr:SBBP repeat-containing protein [Pseudomonadota bacterium]